MSDEGHGCAHHSHVQPSIRLGYAPGFVYRMQKVTPGEEFSRQVGEGPDIDDLTMPC
jgi:hypothetical protein